MPRADVLTRKQEAFLAEYLKDHNGTQAAVRAGYSQGSARAIAGQLLAKPHIKAELARLESELLESVGVTAEQVLRQIQRIAFFDVATIYKNANVLKGHQYKCFHCGFEEFVETGLKVSDGHGQTGCPSPQLTVTQQWAVERVMLHPSEWPTPARAALASMETVIRNLTAGDGLVDTVLKVKLESKVKALEMLANHFGLTKEAEHQTNIQIISWLPPEPPPDPVHALSGSVGSPALPDIGQTSGSLELDRMGFAAAPPAPQDRTPAPVFSDPGTGYTAELEPDPNEILGNSGMSRRAQERMFPELRKSKPRV